MLKIAGKIGLDLMPLALGSCYLVGIGPADNDGSRSRVCAIAVHVDQNWLIGVRRVGRGVSIAAPIFVGSLPVSTLALIVTIPREMAV